jgi:predicted RNase H-like HicB family nuclease
MKNFTKEETKKILDIRKQFPKEISVAIKQTENDCFFAKITNFKGCITEASTFSELIEMVNDCVRTYFEVPKKYLIHMPTYLPPVKAARAFNVFPSIGLISRNTSFIIQNDDHEKVRN